MRSSKYQKKKKQGKLIKKKTEIKKKRTNKNNKHIPNSFFGEIKKNNLKNCLMTHRFIQIGQS